MTTEDVWYDDEAGPLVRLYAITGGRVEAPTGDFTLSAIVRRVPGAPTGDDLSLAELNVVQLTERPMSVSEIAARLSLPLGPVRVILGDLRDAGLITVPHSRNAAERPTMHLLQQVLSGLNSL